MTEYVEVFFTVTDLVKREVLAYRLGEAGTDSIEETEEGLLAYFKKEVWDQVSSLFNEYGPSASEVENKNWNAIWEASFKPVMIDDFCYVRAPFHEASEKSDVIDLILEPRMAFGTAHHETTYMMMSEMANIPFSKQKVFDFGCGTAILSILAEKLGADSIYAIDIEEAAIENAKYNAEINKCQCILAEQKLLHEIEVQEYDTILANINRKVLLDSVASLHDFLKPGGFLLISGILEADVVLVLDTYKNAGWSLISKQQKGEWMCLKFTNSTS